MTKQKSIDEITAAWNDFNRPKTGQIFRHYKGDLYKIVATGFLEDTLAPCVIYRSLQMNTVWVRSAQNFLETVEHNDSTQPRFKSVSG